MVLTKTTNLISLFHLQNVRTEKLIPTKFLKFNKDKYSPQIHHFERKETTFDVIVIVFEGKKVEVHSL